MEKMLGLKYVWIMYFRVITCIIPKWYISIICVYFSKKSWLVDSLKIIFYEYLEKIRNGKYSLWNRKKNYACSLIIKIDVFTGIIKNEIKNL